MLSRADIAVTKTSFTKNLVSDQTVKDTLAILGSPVFDVTYGHGISTATTIAVLMAVGGFNDMRVTGVMRYRAPTTAGAEYLGVMARVQSSSTTLPNYYFARQNAGVFKLSTCIAGSFANLSTGSFALPADVDATIVLSCVGNAITASISASGLSTVNLSATDSTFPTGGLMGYRTLSQVGYCSSISCVQL